MVVVPMATSCGSVFGMFSKCLCRNGCVKVNFHIAKATSLSMKCMLAMVARMARRDTVISRVQVDFMP